MKKFLTLLLALCLALSVATGANAEPEMSAPGEFPIVQETAELNLFAPLSSNIADLNTNVWTQTYEALSNVHINWQTVPSDAMTEKVNLLLAAEDLPDVFFGCDSALNATAQVVYGSNAPSST